MAITWGSISGTQQVGIDVSYSPSVTKDTSSVTITWKIYTRFQPGYQTFGDNETLTLSNALSEVINFYNDDGDVAVLRATRTQVVSTSYAGSVTRTLKGRITGMWNGGTPEHTRSVTIPKRPPQVPDPPTSADLTRVSDDQHNVTWTRPASASTDANLWETTEIYRYSESLGVYVHMVSLTGSPTSWSDTSTQPNNRYRYRVAGKNATGESTQVGTGSRSTTPATPTDVVAQKVGSDIIVTWDESHISGDEKLQIWDYTTLVATVDQNTGSSYTHVAPNPSSTHRYRVRSVTPAAESPVLYSAYSAYSNTVELEAPPNPPTGLSPNGITVERTALSAVTLSWIHNPVDTTDQEAYQIRYRVNGGAWTYTGKINSGVSSRTQTFGSAPIGATIEWEVQTWGADSQPSLYSATASFVLATPPTVTITNPTPGATVTTPSVTVEWGFFHAGSATQNGWTLYINDSGNLRVYQASETDADADHTTPPVLRNNESYVAYVRLRSSEGLWSAWTSVAFDVSFPPPLPPIVETECNEFGFVTIHAQAQSDGSAPETDHIRIERLEENGTWQILADNLGLDTEFNDFTALTSGVNTYRVVSVTAAGAEAIEEVTADCESGCDDIYVSGGPDFAFVVRLRGGDAAVTTGRERVLNQFAGRSRLVETSGVHVPLDVTVNATLFPASICQPGNAKPLDLEALFSLPGPHLYRDWTGRRMYCSLSDVRVGQGYLPSVSFTASRADGGTAEQRAGANTYIGPMVVEVSPGVYTVVGADLTESPPGEWTL